MIERTKSILLAAICSLIAGCSSTPSLRAGMTVAECRDEIGRPLAHQFTTESGGDIVACYAIQPPHHFAPSYLLFHDNALSHVGDIPPFERVVKYFDGRPVSYSRPQTKTLVRVSDVVAAEANNFILPPAEHSSFSESDGNLGPLPFVMLPLYPFMAAQASIEGIVEGIRTPSGQSIPAIQPGIRRDEVCAALGQPQRVAIDGDRTIDLYGRMPKDEEPMPPFRCFAVVYRNDVVEHVVSNDFIDVDWLD